MNGIFYGIGVGPGDPELLTMKAIHALEKVDVLIAPKTEKKEGSVALSIAQPYLKKNIEIVYQVFPMVVRFEESTAAWETNKKEILELLKAGKNVAFLTLGDPMLYSTYIYIYRLLQKESVQMQTIPGIPAFCAIASQMGYPLVEGNDILTIVPATAPEDKVQRALQNTDHVVLMKVYKNFPEIAALLKDENLLDQAVMVSRAGLPEEERITDIWSARQRKVNYLSTILARRQKALRETAGKEE